MKVTVCYYLEFDIEVDKAIADFISTYANGDHLKEGDLWNALTRASDKRVDQVFELTDGGEISCVIPMDDEEGPDVLWEN